MKYLVDIIQEYGHTAEIEANSPEEAEEIAGKMYAERKIDTADFVLLENSFETRCCGVVDENGEKHYN